MENASGKSTNIFVDRQIQTLPAATNFSIENLRDLRTFRTLLVVVISNRQPSFCTDHVDKYLQIHSQSFLHAH